MFSAYVVTPVPPPAPATMVARPSPKNARPRYGSRLRPVIAATALTWPRFSATSTIATGAISVTARASQTGAVSIGHPIHGARATAVKSIGVTRPKPFAASAYNRYPANPPTRIGRPAADPGARTPTSPTPPQGAIAVH